MSVPTPAQQSGAQSVPQQQQGQATPTPQQSGGKGTTPKPQIRDWASI